MPRESTSRSVLGPAERPFVLLRRDASRVLAPFVEHLWIVRWRLERPHEQETLPYPSVHLVLGDAGAGLHGVVTKRFAIVLEGEGRVVAAKFRPGAFFPFAKRDVAELTDRVILLARAFGGAARALDAEVRALDDETALGRLDAFLVARSAPLDDGARTVVRVVDAARVDRAILSVDDLAARFDLAPRTLQRLFRRYVGVSPKWVIRRFRMHEAAERASRGEGVDWAATAAELGYFDQAHFVRDFKAQVGRTPTAYAAFVRGR